MNTKLVLNVFASMSVILRNKGAKKRVGEEGAKSPLKKVKMAEEKKTSSAAPQTVTVEEEITEKLTKEKPKKKKKKKAPSEEGVKIQTTAAE